jgi:hypothetical protein
VQTGEDPELRKRPELKDFNWEDAMVMGVIFILLILLAFGSLYYAYSRSGSQTQ